MPEELVKALANLDRQEHYRLHGVSFTKKDLEYLLDILKNHQYLFTKRWTYCSQYGYYEDDDKPRPWRKYSELVYLVEGEAFRADGCLGLEQYIKDTLKRGKIRNVRIGHCVVPISMLKDIATIWKGFPMLIAPVKNGLRIQVERNKCRLLRHIDVPNNRYCGPNSEASKPGESSEGTTDAIMGIGRLVPGRKGA